MTVDTFILKLSLKLVIVLVLVVVVEVNTVEPRYKEVGYNKTLL